VFVFVLKKKVQLEFVNYREGMSTKQLFMGAKRLKK